MNKDIGLSVYVFGLGAGAFFWGYFLLEVPSNLILEKVGARRWIGRIMISWGLVSGAFVFTQGPTAFLSCGSALASPRPGSSPA
jgi:ACS family tartrate transporter-like MFS transporter